MLIPQDLKTFFYLPAVDLRKAIDGLSIIVSEEIGLKFKTEHLFLFHNKRGDKIKALHYAHNCFSLIYCRIEKGKWVLPKGDTGHLELTEAHLKWLLKSHHYSKLEGLKAADYSNSV